MARRTEITRKATIEQLAKAASTPDFILCRSHLLVHDRLPDGVTKQCPCCGSVTSHIVEDVPDLELLIDVHGSQRYLRHEMFR